MKSKTKKLSHPTDKTEGIVVWVDRYDDVHGVYFNNLSKDYPSLHEALLIAADFFREEYGFFNVVSYNPKLLYDELIAYAEDHDVGKVEIIDSLTLQEIRHGKKEIKN